MDDDRDLGEGNGDSAPRRSAKSFLVRLWVEEGQGEAGERAIRAYIRDLHTGEEQYTVAPEGITRFLLRRLEQEAKEVVGEPQREEGRS